METIRLKCWTCGNVLEITDTEKSVAQCTHCDNIYTIPKANSEKKMHLFARANHLLSICEFDKAESIYESIVAEFPDEAEGYWGLLLCKYGIEYVEDPASGYKVPTCHRASFESFMEDSNYKKVLETADDVARKVYQEKAAAFEQLRQDIMKVSAEEEPYDIFISFKHKDENGNRTLDSVLAQDLYTALTEKGYRVFYSHITLRSHTGVNFEPYIFAALNSAKVMLVVGTCSEYLNAVWVKNEWSRFLKLMATDRQKCLFPCYKDMDPEEDMPKEFKRLQRVDLSQVGAINDIILSLETYVFGKKQAQSAAPQSIANATVDSYLERAYMFLEDSKWDKADEYFEKVLDMDPKNARAYLGKLLALHHWVNPEKLQYLWEPFGQEEYYQKAIRFADPTLKATLEGYLNVVLERNYSHAVKVLQTSTSADEVLRAGERFKSIRNYKNAPELVQACTARANRLVKEGKYAAAVQVMKTSRKPENLLAAAKQLVALASDFPDAARLAEECRKDAAWLTQEANKKAEYDRQNAIYHKALQRAEDKEQYALRDAADMLSKIPDFKDARQLAKTYRDRHEEFMNKLHYDHAVFQKEYADSKAPSTDWEKKQQQECYEEALKIFEQLSGYRDADKLAHRIRTRKRRKVIRIIAILMTIVLIIMSLSVWAVVILPEKNYAEAEKMYAEGNYLGAAEKFRYLHHRDSDERYLDAVYRHGEVCLEDGNTSDAMFAFGTIPDYKDARERSWEMWNNVRENKTIDGEYTAMAHIKNDGTVRISGRGDKAYFSDVVHVLKNKGGCYALKEDGTVGYTDGTSESSLEWTNIVDIAYIGGELLGRLIGLQMDGTVVVDGNLSDAYKEAKDIYDWEKIVAIAASYDHVVGLKADGTVVAAGKNDHGQLDVSGWSDVISVDAGGDYTVGLKADGTVVLAGKISTDVGSDMSTWKKVVQICAAGDNVLGLKADGTVVGCGVGSDGSLAVSKWTGIVAVAGNSYQSVGVKADGTVVAVGLQYYPCYDEVHEWTNVRVPAKKESAEE